MLSEINDIRKNLNEDFKKLETAGSQKTEPVDVVNNETSLALSTHFDTLYL